MLNEKVIIKKNLLHNVSTIKNYGKKICAVVKADAYGHGANEITKIIASHVSFFAVANVDEGENLRKYNHFAKILILGKTFDYSKALNNNLSITIDSFNDLLTLENISKRLNKIALVHVKINTGMNRIGLCDTSLFLKMCNFISKSNNLILEGVFTHFFTADCDNVIFNNQMARFNKYVKVIPKTLNPIIHVGGSFVLNHNLPKYIDMVRVGLWLYGYGRKDLKPILKIYSRIVEVNNIKKGDYVGYGKQFIATKDMIIATIQIGYADGFVRALSNKGYVKVQGKKCKILGLVCMDMIMCDITNLKNKVVPKDKVLVFDNAKKISKLTGISEYEILTNFIKLR